MSSTYLVTWLDFGGIQWENAFFFLNFSRSNTLLTISQEWLVQLTRNEKEVHQLHSGWTIWNWNLTSTMTLTLDFSRSNFENRNSCYQELLVWLMWIVMEVNQILGWLHNLALWPHPWPWPWSFKVKVWNGLISRMGRPIAMVQKGRESSFHDNDIDLCVTMVGCVDVFQPLVCHRHIYRKVSNIRHTLVGNKIFDHSDVVEASPVGAAPTNIRGALLFFKVIYQISWSGGTKKSPILTWIGCFRTVTPVWIHRWLWNDAQSLK